MPELGYSSEEVLAMQAGEGVFLVEGSPQVRDNWGGRGLGVSGVAEKTVTGGRPGGVWRWQGPWRSACVPLLWAVSRGRSPQWRLAGFDFSLPQPLPGTDLLL